MPSNHVIIATLSFALALAPSIGHTDEHYNNQFYFTTLEDAGQETVQVVSEHFPRTEKPRGQAALSPRILNLVGGIVAQASLQEGPLSVSVPRNSPAGSYPGHIMLGFENAMVAYPIAYADLVPMAMFVEGDSTILYTLHDTSTAPHFTSAAGLIDANGQGLIAFEFAGTTYHDALHHLDVCRSCVPQTDRPFRSESHLNHDVGQEYAFHIGRDSSLVPHGRIVRTYWRLDDDETKSEQELETEHVTVLLPDCIAGHRSKEKVRSAHFLFRTLALLRTAKQDSSSQWSQFLGNITSEDIILSDPQPWVSYTKSLCSVDGVRCGEQPP